VLAVKKRHGFGLLSAVILGRDLLVGHELDVTKIATNRPERE
jgi:hypothetical protein